MRATILLALAACGGGSEPGIAGKWEGTSETQQRFAITIAESDGAITGTGVIGRRVSVPFDGVHDDGGIARTATA